MLARAGQAMQSVLLVAAIGVFSVIAYDDIRRRRISNALSLAIAILGLIRIVLNDDTAAPQTLAAASIIFAATFLLFWGGVIGGGDAKLMTATVLLVGSHELVRFLLLMSLSGGLLALTTIAQQQFRHGDWGLGRRVRQTLRRGAATSSIAAVNTTVPYGVAVAAAGVISLVLEGPLAR